MLTFDMPYLEIKTGTEYYIIDLQNKVFHKDSCPLLAQNKEFKEFCDGFKNRIKISQCKKCNPLLLKKIKEPPKTKAQIIKEQLIIISEKYGMHLEFVGNTAYVTTSVGEWFFDYTIRPIRLHHKNSEKRIENGIYHIQENKFHSPTHTLAYINKHELATLKRLMTE